jgi:valyl-tRNA synthetase
MALSTMLRLFAPFLPFVTEEVWSWWREGSIHRSAWPTKDEVLAACGGAEDNGGVDSLQFAATVLGAIRKKKSEEQRALKTLVAKAVIHAPSALLGLLPEVESDLRASGLIQQIETAPADTLHVEVELAPPELSREERPS